MAFCTRCGTQIADGSICPNCAATAPASAPVASTATTGGMTDNIAGALAYFTIIPAIIFLVLEPYNRSRFVRFHAWQCILFYVAWIILWFGLHILAVLTFFLWPIVVLAGFILWIILVIKAYQGQMFKIPAIGDIAEKQANA
jgi:uncharacterized membrane protein